MVDVANTLYRAFFAIPPLRTADGLPTNAIHGFAQTLQKVVREERPHYLVAAMDAPGPTRRAEAFEDYKATRDKQPEELALQIPVVREIIDAHGIPLLEVPGYEADDVIATLVRRAPPDVDVVIVSTDKDLMQLVGERVTLLDAVRDRRYGPAEVEERFGVPPERILDLRALVGDPSDNIPGVRGIGEKGAAALIRRWDTLDRLLEHVDEVEPKRAREALRRGIDAARLSRELARLHDDLALPVELEDCRLREPDRARLREIYTRYELRRLLEALGPPEGEAEPEAAGPEPEETPCRQRIVDTLAGLEALGRSLPGEGPLHVAAVASGPGAMQAELAGVAFALRDGEVAYVPVGHRPPAGELGPGELASALAGPLRAAARGLSARDVKLLLVQMGEHGVELPPPRFDLDVAAFLADPAGPRTPKALARSLLGREIPDFEDVAGRGARGRTAPELGVEEAADLAGREVQALAALEPRLRDRLDADGLRALFEEVELPLVAVLARMERAGIRVDEVRLAELSREYQDRLDAIEAEIHRLAGERFLIGSPKQLQRILFEKLGLPAVKRTKTGYSTDESVLEQLAPLHELPALVLAHRRLAKLRSTYLEALPKLIHPATGRIHPSFHQTGAATGRLSCSNPNVQNIPIRTEEGIRIREAFVAEEGMRLLSADYSQVELRILAHYSGDPSLLEAFRSGEDVHRRTAAEVAGIDPSEVSAEQRDRAKAVNFGIIYGSSAFGLARQLGLAQADAQETIDAYFRRYRGVREFLDRTVAEARERGYVTTLLGRRRYLPDLRSRNRALRTAAERMAVNTVIQGTAADLIKKAMVEVDAALRREGLAARMILQVHDELVFELPPEEEEVLTARVRAIMEGVFELAVPLRVDIGVGRSWRDAH